MITKSPYSHTNAIKPGRIPEPIKEPIHTCDPPEIIAICLACPVAGGCHPEMSVCPLNGKHREPKHREPTEKIRKNVKLNQRTVRMLERDERLLYMLTHGWRNTEAICEELGIKSAALSAAKKRLRERGAIP